MFLFLVYTAGLPLIFAIIASDVAGWLYKEDDGSRYNVRRIDFFPTRRGGMKVPLKESWCVWCSPRRQSLF